MSVQVVTQFVEMENAATWKEAFNAIAITGSYLEVFDEILVWILTNAR